MKNVIGGVATTHFVMQKLFTVLKEKHLPTEHGLDVLQQIVNYNSLNVQPFSNFN